jgi:nucleotide-binding universal stress UspA family protein
MKSLYPFNVTRILCPVDRSELSSLALKYAVVGAGVFGARLTVLEAVHFDYPRYLSEELTNTVLQELSDYKASAREDLSAHVRSVIGASADTIRIDYLISDLQPALAISQAVDETQADLLVMGTHGYSGVKHWILGSVTESLLHVSRIPVFAVRQKMDDFIDAGQPDSEPEIYHILCLCDLDVPSARALQVAASLGERFDARVTALYGSESDGAGDDARFREWIAKTVGDYPISGMTRQGAPAAVAIETAAEMKSDLIVMGARHRSFGQATALGRTTELVMRHAPVPVLGVPFFESAD